MRLIPLLLALALAVGAGFGVWLYYGQEANPGPRLAPADSLEQRAEAALENGTAEGRARATELLRQALEADPASPYRWCRLGEALAESGDEAGARKCFQRGIELGPNIPPVRMRAANFYFANGWNREGIEQTRRILELVRDYDAAIFATYERMEVPASQVMAEGLPPDRAARVAWFHYLLARRAREDAASGWPWLEKSGASDAPLAAEYASFLLREGSYGEAREIWARQAGRQNPGYPAENRVFNGGFEAESLNKGLDWTVSPLEGVAVERDAAAHSGKWSLAVAFNGQENLDYRRVSQAVVAEPGQYRFSAWMRTEQITTNEGPRFRIGSATPGGRLEVLTDALTGTQPWTEITAPVTVPRGVGLLRVELARQRSLKFDSRISGRVWIDDVRLEPVE